MGRFPAAAQVAAFFLIAGCLSPPAQAQDCEDCNRIVTGSSQMPDTWRDLGRLDVADALDSAASVAEYVAAYIADEPAREVEMPDFRRKYHWQLTYRSDAAHAVSSQPAQAERFPGLNTTLDDSWVVGLRFEMDYGWIR